MAEFHPNAIPGVEGIPGAKLPGSQERNAMREAEAWRHQRSTRESLNDELLGTATSPYELIFAVRRIEKTLESGTIPPSLNEGFRPPSQLSIMLERAEDLKMSGEALRKAGFLLDYEPASGLGVPRASKYSIMAIDTEPVVITDDKTLKEIVAFNYGSPEVRSELAASYEEESLELETRAILGEHIGVRLNLNARDALEAFVDWQHGTRATLKYEHLQTLTNLPKIDLENARVEKRELGYEIAESSFMYLIMLNSGTKDRMNYFMHRPATNALIDRLRVKETGSGPDGKMTREEWIEKYVGVISEWTDDRLRKKTTFIKEAREVKNGKKIRGLLTQYGNIASYEGAPTGVNVGEENEFIEKIVGKAVGSVEASWVAATLLRDIGAYASEGYVAFPNENPSLALGEGRYIASDDTGKFWPYMWNMKEGTKGRKSGLKDMIGRIPDMAMSLFDWAQLKIPDLDVSGKPVENAYHEVIYKEDAEGRPIYKLDEWGDPIFRSIIDAWLGTPEQFKKNLLTGAYVELDRSKVVEVDRDDPKKMRVKKTIERDNPITGEHEVKEIIVAAAEKEIVENGGKKRKILAELVPEEPGHELGNLKFDTLLRDFHGNFGIMQWLLGREKDGVLTNAMNTKFTYEDMELDPLKAAWKYIGICFNPVIMTKGSTQLYDFSHGELKTIQENYFQNIIAARMGSYNFRKNIMPQEIVVYDPRTGTEYQHKVSAVALIDLFARAVLDGNPRNQDELIANYIDDNEKLMNAGEIATAKAIVARWKTTDNVGKVTGKVKGGELLFSPSLYIH